MDNVTFHSTRMFHPNESEEYKQYAVKHMRQEVGLKLFHMIYEQRLPCVVDIEEESWPDRFKILVGFTPVKYRNVEIAVMPELKFPVKETLYMKIRNYVRKQLVHPRA